MFIKEEDNRWYVVAESGKVLGVFGSKEAAERYSEQMSSVRQYSSTVRSKGEEAAMDTFLERFKKSNKN